ncbi:hypothetical protein GDO86_012753 [Hymenochirus boettgeri]|uniref:Uncharacterized protein n=1 Tax=Hymenochirus boettgeri TaxID=247094 RepID=A0A8T2IR88_9PIPI|nr:hypothetical protein GDO86_012753 [Hymenochirus boettgeri]
MTYKGHYRGLTSLLFKIRISWLRSFTFLRFSCYFALHFVHFLYKRTIYCSISLVISSSWCCIIMSIPVIFCSVVSFLLYSTIPHHMTHITTPVTFSDESPFTFIFYNFRNLVLYLTAMTCFLNPVL